MNRFWKPAPWVNRVLLAFATVGYALLGTKYLVHPVRASAADGISLGSPAAITDMRVVGALFELYQQRGENIPHEKGRPRAFNAV
jgi:hypothetical protein